MMRPAPADVTLMLQAWCNGDATALEKLAPVVEAELRRLARLHLSKEKPGQTLQPTALINEAYLRLIAWNSVEWQDRAHFFAVAAKLMRRILVNQAIARSAKKRGASPVLISLSEASSASDRTAEITALDEALIALASIDERKAQLVDLRFFAGLTAEEAAEVLGVSVRTVHREWDLTRAWLFRELRGSHPKP
jgi:RNA polymerase sigma-70 factor, ECF subfamily